MNHAKSALRASPHFVPPDVLLKFGYSPSGGIEFDSAAALLSFSNGGTPKADIGSSGMYVRDGLGLVVGHNSEVTSSTVPKLQVLGTGTSGDSLLAVGRWSNNGSAPDIQLIKSRGGSIDTNAIVQDGDTVGDISWIPDDGSDLQSPAARISVEIDGTPGNNDTPGRMIFKTTPDGSSSATEALRIDSSQNVQMRSESHLWIGPADAGGDFASARVNVGLVVNQEATGENVLLFKSSSVATGRSYEETDTFGLFGATRTNGGLGITSLSENVGTVNDAMILKSVAGDANVTHTVSGRGHIEVYATQIDASGNTENLNATGNIFAARGHIDGSSRTVFIVDEDGSYWFDGAAQAAFDHEDDLSIVRAIDLHTADPASLVRGEFDEYVHHNEADLVKFGVLGAPVADGGLINGAQLSRVHNGAIWQLNTAHMSLVERVDSLVVELELATKQLAALTA